MQKMVSLHHFMEIQPISETHDQVTTSIFDKVHPKIFQSAVKFYIFVSAYKNQDILSFVSKNIVDFKILRSGWPRAFWPLYHFLRIWDLYRDII